MPVAYVVTQGSASGELIKRCLPRQLTGDVCFATGGGWSSAMSLAGTILLEKRRPVALVVDAESEHDSVIEERRDFTKSFLRQTSVGVPCEVFLAVPEIEVLLFQSNSVLSHLTGNTISEVESERARHHPKKWLTEAGVGYPKEIAALLDRLTEDDLKALRQDPLIRALEQFLAQAIAGDGPSRGQHRRTVQI